MKTLIRCDIIAKEEQVEVMCGLLALHISFGWEEQSLPSGETRFRIHYDNREFIENLQTSIRKVLPFVDIEIFEVPNEDWTQAWREFFTPVLCGERFLVLPPWLNDDTLSGRKNIIIEPKSAFGTGHHSTTTLCLGVISDLLDSGRLQPKMEFLDLGTGSGILGLGCCHFDLYGVGLDTDSIAIDNALENQVLNGIGPYNAQEQKGFDILLGSVEKVQGRKFDLIIANILAGPLKELAPQLIALRKENACIILSGILVMQADAVIQAYTDAGLHNARIITEGEWAAIVWD